MFRCLGRVSDPEGVIAIDSKTVRRSGRQKDDTAPIHMISAFAARQRLVLGQVKVAEKSNEIIAVPKPLTMLAIEGAIVTIDAMGCQRDIAKKLLDKKADYVLALKGNQGSRPEDIELFAREQKARDFADTKLTRHAPIEGDHSRIETHTTTMINDVEWLQERHDWPGLQAVAMVESSRKTNEKTLHETRFYLTSLVVALIGPIVRSHWSIENSLHWVWT
jgi:predicted transposase YbfD/YdcC